MNKIKDFLLGYKLRFIKRNAPEIVTHWNEDNKSITFHRTYLFDENIKPIIVRKPLWLRIIEFIVY